MPNFELVHYCSTIHELIQDERREEEQKQMEYNKIKKNCSRLCLTCNCEICPEMKPIT